ncbi:MAG: ETC complex I subunit [Alphaproteobacteria bacterium]|nr:ETC complex I subunit [Alphaproteobacteria bacterium]MDE2336557.1 ETC complex I subunit [Alphaproteobacteria bacterium]
MKAKIYKPVKNTMQSGRANTAEWVLEYELATPRRPEPLMGWVSAGDTLNQVRISFLTKDDAVAFAEKEGLEYDLVQPHARKVKPQSYIDNFKWHPPEEKNAG